MVFLPFDANVIWTQTAATFLSNGLSGPVGSVAGTLQSKLQEWYADYICDVGWQVASDFTTS
jgi:hypothetical protein